MNAIEQLKELAAYVEGMADAQDNDKLREAAKWLKKSSRNVCGQGFLGCNSGERCTSDHK